MPSGDARIDFDEEVSPGKGTLQTLVKTVVPFLILVLTKVLKVVGKRLPSQTILVHFSTFYIWTYSDWVEFARCSTWQLRHSPGSTEAPHFTAQMHLHNRADRGAVHASGGIVHRGRQCWSILDVITDWSATCRGWFVVACLACHFRRYGDEGSLGLLNVEITAQ